MNYTDKMIFLDFDGVLFNTVKEAYAVCCIAMNRYDSIDDIDFSTKHYEYFLNYRYLIGPAWNYKYLWELLEVNNMDFEQIYIKVIKKAKHHNYKNFEKLFFDTRIKLQEKDFTGWLKLNEPYDFLGDIKQYLLNNDKKFIIVTTKDRETVKKLLEIEDIKVINSNIYDRNDFFKYGNKGSIINHICVARGIKESMFIDDSKKHLIQCSEIENIELLQASWGYVAKKDQREALDMNVVVDKINFFLG